LFLGTVTLAALIMCLRECEKPDYEKGYSFILRCVAAVLCFIVAVSVGIGYKTDHQPEETSNATDTFDDVVVGNADSDVLVFNEQFEHM